VSPPSTGQDERELDEILQAICHVSGYGDPVEAFDRAPTIRNEVKALAVDALPKALRLLATQRETIRTGTRKAGALVEFLRRNS